MALLYLDSFDYYSSAQLTGSKFPYALSGSAPTITAAGRTGTNCLRMTTGQVGCRRRLTTNYATLIMGVAFKATSFTFRPAIFNVADLGTTQVTLCADVTTGQLKVYRGNAEFGTDLSVTSGLNTLATNTWYYIEMLVTIHNTTGAVQVRVNGADWIALTTGLNTRASSNNQINEIGFGRSGSNNSATGVDYDDYYVLDQTGSAPTNDFLGDVRVECLFPNGAGNYTQFTPSTGSNYQNVDDTTANDATDYNSSATAGQKDTYAFTNLTTTGGAVYGVALNSRYQKSEGGTRTVRGLSRHGGVDGTGPTFTPGAGSWEYRQDLLLTNPSTSSAWTPSEVNAAEFGMEVVS